MRIIMYKKCLKCEKIIYSSKIEAYLDFLDNIIVNKVKYGIFISRNNHVHLNIK